MCLTLKKHFKTIESAKKSLSLVPRIAKRDIKVYKKLIPISTTTYTSPCQHFIYERGTHYYQVGKKFTISFEYNNYNNYHEVCITRGLHAYKTKPSPYSSSIVVIEMIIPKGSQYYLGKNNDIVVDNLIWY